MDRAAETTSAVQAAFTRGLASQTSGGAAAGVFVEGQLILDAHGGEAKPGQPWKPHTLVNVYSAAKPLAAACALLLWDRGQLELDQRVATYWPEYAQAGKERTTVRMLLAHQAGLLVLRERQSAHMLLDFERLVELLAAEPPVFEPGSAHGEHALFYGHLIGELVRRIDGRPLGRFFREEIAEPWRLDFHFGLERADETRAATLLHPGADWRQEVLANRGDLYRQALDNPPGALDLDVVNGAVWRTAGLPAVGGHGTALALARFYAGFAAGGALDGVRLFRPGTVAEALQPARVGPDVLLGRDVAWGLGFQIDGDIFGMAGIGGSDGWGYTELRYGCGYVTNHLRDHDRAEQIDHALRSGDRAPPS